MIINEIICESRKLDEISPTSIRGQGLGGGLKALGKKAMTATGAALGYNPSVDKQAVDQRATELYQEFATYARRSGMTDFKAMPKDELTQWFKKQNYPIPNLGEFPGNNINLDDHATSSKFWTKVAWETVKQGHAGLNPVTPGGQRFGIPAAQSAAPAGAPTPTPAAAGGTKVPGTASKNPTIRSVVATIKKMSPKQQQAIISQLTAAPATPPAAPATPTTPTAPAAPAAPATPPAAQTSRLGNNIVGTAPSNVTQDQNRPSNRAARNARKAQANG